MDKHIFSPFIHLKMSLVAFIYEGEPGRIQNSQLHFFVLLLSKSFQCFLAFMVSARSYIILLQFLFVSSHFPLLVVNFFFFFLVFTNVYSYITTNTIKMQNICITPKLFPCIPLQSISSLLSQALTTTDQISITIALSFLELHINGVI